MSTVIVGPDKDGQEVTASIHDVIILKLPESPTTGVRWGFDRLEGPVELAGDSYERPDSSSGIGAMTSRLLTLQPKSPGNVSVRLKRWQEWEGDSSIDATFSCVIKISN